MNPQQAEQLLAAYLLNELDARTRSEVEAVLQADAALRDRLADLRLTLKLAHQGLEEEAAPQLSEARRAALMMAVAGPPKVRVRPTKPWWRRLMPASIAAVAAALLLVLGLGWALTLSKPMAMARRRIYSASQAARESEEYPEEAVARPAPANAPDMAEPALALSDGSRKGWELHAERQYESKLSALGRDRYKELDADRPSIKDKTDLLSLSKSRESKGFAGGGGPSPGDEDKRLYARRPKSGDRTGDALGVRPDGSYETSPPGNEWAQKEEGGKRKLNLGGSAGAGMGMDSAKGTLDDSSPWENGDKEKLDSSDFRAYADKLTADAPPPGGPITITGGGALTLNGNYTLNAPPSTGDLTIAGWDGATVTAGTIDGHASNLSGITVGGAKARIEWVEKSLRKGEEVSSLETRAEAASPRGEKRGEAGATEGTAIKSPAKPSGLKSEEIATADKSSSGVVHGLSKEPPAPVTVLPKGEPADSKPSSAAPARPEGRRDGAGKDQDHEAGLPPASSFREVPVNPWVMTERDRFSTFASDVDTASYALCRSYLRAGHLPPRGAVRMEEFINAFDYNYPRRAAGVFNVFAEGAASPFAEGGEGTTLLKIGVQGRVVGREGRKDAHLVLVIDVSGSMAKPDRLPLIQQSLRMLVDALRPDDRVSLIAYSREASLLLECAAASRREEILAACDNLRAGGPTNLLAGLEAGYELARREFVAGRINRVILCSDGAANIGQTDAQAILDRVAAYRRHGITLTIAGFGRGGYNDELLETLAKQGDGSYLFVDTLQQAREVFVEKMSATLQTIALDAKIQVEFNPRRVRRYRLIGYEKRQIADVDFRNDAVDAAEVGSGQSATALYEVELPAAPRDEPAEALGTVFVRYRNAETHEIEEISHRLEARIVRPAPVEETPRFYLAACAGRFAEILRESPHAKNGNLEQVQGVLQHVCRALPLDNQASELLWMVRRARGLPRSP